MNTTILAALVLAQQQVKTVDFVELIGNSSGIIMVIMVLLGVFSFVSWYIIAYKAIYLWKTKRDSAEFTEVFWESKRLDEIYRFAEEENSSPVANVFKAGYMELTRMRSGESRGTIGYQLGGIENIERSLRKASNEQVNRLESMLPFLATTASTAPFLGLLGTVLGIMNSFVNIAGQKSVTLDTVAPGVAEALVTTAVGLMAAIPAVMAYNYFISRVRHLTSEMDSFSADFLNIVKRHFLK